MSTLLKTVIISIYFLFTQIYPIVHLHAQEHHDNIEIHLSIHPSDIRLNNTDHHSRDKANDAHEHEAQHYNGDLDYTFKPNIKVATYDVETIHLEFTIIEPAKAQVSSRIPKNIPLKIPDPYITCSISKRAPPLTSCVIIQSTV